jgi:photosystem II stability/assembly factor-like uncharacterized protein
MPIRTIRAISMMLSWFIIGCGGESGQGGVWVSEELPTRAEFNGLYFVDGQRGFIVGGHYFIDGGIVGTTEDGGHSWTFRTGLVSAKRGFSLTDVTFVDRFVGIAVGTHGVILRTVDRGSNWHPVGRFGGIHFHDVDFIDDRHGWAIGTSGIVGTSDGGSSWVRLTEPRAVDGYAVHFVSRERGVVVGRHGAIHLTTDGGVTWTRITERQTPATADLLGLTFVGPHRGWAVGCEGTILHTTDGGRTWARQVSGVASRLVEVCFVDPDRGWTVGSEREGSRSTILRTIDGGASWAIDLEVKGELLRSLFFRETGLGWAAGERPEHGPQKLLRYRAQ